MANRHWGLGLIAAVVLGLAGQGIAAEIPPCSGNVEVSGVPVNRVENDAVIVLGDGRATVAEGIRLPQGAADHAPDFFAEQALATLSALSRGRTVELRDHMPKEDRYGRLRAQVFVPGAGTDSWIQTAMLRRGLARVEISPDRPECAAELYAAEAAARSDRLGIWNSSAYAIRTPTNLAGDAGTFQIVQGTVVSATVTGGRAYLDFGPDWHTDFTVSISSDDMKSFAAAGVDPRGYQGKTIRVRGIVQNFDGPEIEIAVPEQIESVSP